ncbi:MAG: triose-phosphate isomerase family protein, partial [Eubacteriales bacterium]
MKKIYLNLKRFDVTPEKGGVNRIAKLGNWANFIVTNTKDDLKAFNDKAKFTMFFPEVHILSAVNANDGTINIGCQSVNESDTAVGGNFGAFTTLRPANAMALAGANTALIGHCEERNYYKNILSQAGVSDLSIVNKFFNQKVHAAINAGLDVLYCIGETSEEQSDFEAVLKTQLELGLKDADLSKITIAYEPVWSIGPGKTPADKPYITKIAQYVKTLLPDTDIVYGGGLKEDNAKMLASIPEISGGLIA